MADWTPPAEASVVETPAWTPPAEAKPVAPATTTTSGIAASAARGLAPYAAGAAIGAAAGAPFAGVGAVPGAIAGMGAAGLTELGGTLYNAIAPRVSSLPKVMTPQGATDRMMDAMGIMRPSTPVEHAAEMIGGIGPLGIGSAKGAAGIGDMVLGNRADAAEKFVERAYEKAIRPTVVGKGNDAKRTEAEWDVISNLSSIIGNKANLRLADKNGREVVGRTPRSLDEYVQAIAQTKRPVFDKYDALTRQGDALGLKIDTNPAAAELRKFAADPSFALPAHKSMRDYATATADALESGGALLPSVAQNMVRNLNEGLSGFYRKSSPEAASKAAVDDLVANQLRRHVDDALEKAGLPGWQEARHELGALISTESEVAHRAGVYGRQDAGGGLFGRLGTIASYEELARFAMTHDPVALASAAAIRGGRQWLEYWRGPNLAVRRMFNKAEKYDLQPDIRGARPSTSAAPAGAVTGGMQPPRPGGPVQSAGGGTSTGIHSGGAGSASSSPMGPGAVGPQPPQPTGAPYVMPQGGGVLQGGGNTVPGVQTPQPGHVAPINPFLTPPGGGRQSMVHPDDGLARALMYG